MFITGFIVGFAASLIMMSLFIKEEYEYCNSRIEYWYKSSIEYLEIIKKITKSKELEKDPADWWKNNELED